MDVFFFPSSKEGVPISITEALVMGVPVLTLNTRGCRELVTDDLNGYVIHNSLSKDLLVTIFSDRILNLIKHEKILKRFKNYAMSQRQKLDRKNFILENAEWYTNYFLYE